MSRVCALDVPFAPVVPVPHPENFLTTRIAAPEVGTSGHSDAVPRPHQAVHARAPEDLEVTEVGTVWASAGTCGRDSAAAAVAPQRARMWKFSLPLLHPDTGLRFADLHRLSAGLLRKSIGQYMWLIHDRDPGAAPHLQGVIKMSNSRSRDQLASMLGLPVTAILPLVDGAGQHGAFERYCRYLLHESPEAQADGKFRYPDSDVRANFDFRDMIDRYFGHTSNVPRLTSSDIKLKVYNGELTPLEVLEHYPRIFIQLVNVLEDLWDKGVYARLRGADLAEHYARTRVASAGAAPATAVDMPPTSLAA